MLRKTRCLTGALVAALFAGNGYAQTGSSSQQQSGQSGMSADQQRSEQGTGTSARQGADQPSTGGGQDGVQGQSSSTGKGKQLSAAQKAEATRTLAKLHASNQAEIDAGTYMKEHATNDKVKDFASKMVDDHGKLDKDATDFAQKHDIELTAAAPSSEMTKEMDSLKKMQGAQADRTYMRMMVRDHARDLKDTRAAEQQAKRSGNKDLAKLLDSSAKKIEDHGKDAQKIDRDLTQRQARKSSGQ